VLRLKAEQQRLVLTWAGRAISAAALVAVVFYFVRSAVWRTVDLRDARLGATLAGATLAYAAGQAVMGYGWVRWLRCAGQAVPASAGTVLYCRAQLAKYIPGNVFHLAARQTLGKRLGAAQAALAFASAAESTALVIVAVALGTLGNGLPPGLPRVPRAAAFLVACLFLAAAVMLPRLARRPARLSIPRQGLDTLISLGCYLPFFAWNGLALALLLSFHHAIGPGDLFALTGVWSLCWLAGYLVPGAPGGIGIREAALILCLSPWCGRAEGAVIAVEMRLVSTLGDVMLWLFATAFGLAGRTPVHATTARAETPGAYGPLAGSSALQPRHQDDEQAGDTRVGNTGRPARSAG